MEGLAGRDNGGLNVRAQHLPGAHSVGQQSMGGRRLANYCMLFVDNGAVWGGGVLVWPTPHTTPDRAPSSTQHSLFSSFENEAHLLTANGSSFFISPGAALFCILSWLVKV